MRKVLPGDPGLIDVENGVEHFPNVGAGRLAGGPPIETGLLPGGQGGPISAQRASEMSLGYARRAVTVEIYSGQGWGRSSSMPAAIHGQAYVRRNSGRICSQNGRHSALSGYINR